MKNPRADAWTDLELQYLYDVVNDPAWFGKVAPYIDRSENAIRARMSALRAEAGIIPGVRGPRSSSRAKVDSDQAEQGSSALLTALVAMVPRPAIPLPREPGAEVQLAMFDGPLFDWRHAA